MTCNDCVHWEACKGLLEAMNPDYKSKNIVIKHCCKRFKNKADFMEVVRCQKCAYREACNKEIYVEQSYTSIGWCSEGERRMDK